LINQKLAIGLLEKWGHKVTVANNGLEAVEQSANGKFDLILMDVQMPELDGLDATKSIRRREDRTGEHIPIVAMTAHAMKGDRERCLEAGMDDYLMKPIRADELFRALERIGGNSIPIDVHESAVATSNDRVNWDSAQLAVNHDAELLRDVLEAFLEEGPQLVETMLDSANSNDSKRFQRAAHTLKSGLRMFGVSPLDSDVEQLELSAKDGNIPVESLASLGPVIERTRRIFAEMSTHS
jgi:two-component system sensor histidine kinase/response regulator